METERFSKNEGQPLNIIKEKRVLAFAKYAHHIQGPQVRQLSEVANGASVLDLSSNAKKIIVYVNHSPYHLINDIVGDVCWFLDQSNDHEVILNVEFENHQTTTAPGRDSRKYVVDILQMLSDEYKTRVSIHSLATYDAVIVDNLQIDSLPISMSDRTLSSYNFFKKVLGLSTDIIPTRKVYLSRRYNSGQRFLALHNGKDIEIDHDRIKDEDLLEEYFSKKGFEIVRPEEFSSFTEQARFFSEVSTIVSVTSSGLTNLIFMQPGQVVVELMTLLPLINGRMSLVETNPPKFEVEEYILEAHHFYKTMSYTKNHTYVSAPNIDKRPETIIKFIETSPVLSKIF